MTAFKKYSHVKDFILHYSDQVENKHIQDMMANGIANVDQAEVFAKFIWLMLDLMAHDNKIGKIVLGSQDNSSIIPDIEYEVSLYLADAGYENVWERACDEN